jgi:DnaK suppressor protein
MATPRKSVGRPTPKTTAKAKSAPAPAPPPPRRKEKPPAPESISFDPEWINTIREALLQRRSSLNTVVESNRNMLASNQGDLSDIADRASTGFEDELTAGLLSIEVGQLEEINEALERIESGTYGVCIACRKAIPRKRLEILPFAKRCLKCEAAEEQSARMAHPEESEEEEAD